MTLPAVTPRWTIGTFGDSEDAGYGDTPGGAGHNCGFRYLLQQLGLASGMNLQFLGNQTLPGADANTEQIFHNGIAGDTIAGATTRVLQQPWLIPQIPLIKVGTNDVLNLAVLGTMTAQLSTHIDTVWFCGQRGPGATNRTRKIILAQIPDVFTGANVAAMHTLVGQYNAAMPGIVSTKQAAGINIALIDLFTPLGVSNGSNPNFNAGSVPHQSAAGYAIEAPIWFGVPGSGLICDAGRLF